MEKASATSAPAARDCVLFATADWDTPYWTNKQHTAVEMAKLGWRVLYVESVGLRAPNLRSGMDWGRIARRLWRGLRGPRKVQDNIWVISPLTIPFKHGSTWVRAFNQGYLAWTIRRFLNRQGFSSPLIWTYHPFVLQTLEQLRLGHAEEASSQVVYHCVDDLSAIPGVDKAAFNAEEVRLLERADAVFTTATSLRDKCARHNSNTHLYPNVADPVHFGKALQPGPLHPSLAGISEPRIAYIGALSDFKVDFSLLHEVALARPDWQFVLVGDEREGQHNATLRDLSSLPNVHRLGYQPYAALPELLRGIQVGLLPTLINEYTRGMFPMKYYEYLSAGVPVVSTPLEFTQATRTWMEVADNASGFVQAIDKQLKTAAGQRDQVSLAIGDNTWGARMSAMLSRIPTQNQTDARQQQ
ncbi:glycosyltransferase [Hydrogenophaga sp. 5NK40-0174]|uniref:glycosyltransferase n=1 Tax=Hydrogenophaga sp. 5NK40-0174 TaxID=3127649 RepID=UPI003103F960